MTHILHINALDLKIEEKVLDPPTHKMVFKGKITVDTRNKLLMDYIESVPLVVVPKEMVGYMKDEIEYLRNKLDEKGDYIDSLKEAAKILIEAASMREDEDPVCRRMKIDEAERKCDRNDPF